MNKLEIMKLIGIGRLVMLGFMSSALAVFVCVHFLVINPMLTNAEDELSMVKNDISTLRGKIGNVKSDIEYMNNNMSVYDGILRKGLFEDQDRFRVVNVVDKLRDTARNIKFNYNIGEREVMQSEDAKTMGYALIKRSITLSNVAALIDVDVYNFFQTIKDVFPMFVHIKSFAVRKVGKVDIPTLQGIADGKVQNMVNAEISFDWVTLSKKEGDLQKSLESSVKGKKRR